VITSDVSTGSGNLPPVAEANGPYTGKRNTPISFSSAGSSDPSSDTLKKA